MSSGERYRILTPTLAITFSAGQRVIVTIPKDIVVEVISGPLKDERMVDIRWKGQKLLMFSQDLCERGEVVEERVSPMRSAVSGHAV